jgi:hypothetical protein
VEFSRTAGAGTSIVLFPAMVLLLAVVLFLAVTGTLSAIKATVKRKTEGRNFMVSRWSER